jgi:ribonucleoside-diphosphate reductase alpha chain
MPDDAESQRHKFTVGSMDVIVQCGKYPDGSLGEIFITASAQGSTMRGMLDCFAICFSMSLQYGLPLKELIKKFTNAQFEPHGFTGKSDIAFCSSIIDYVMKYLALNFLTEKETKSIGLFRNGTPSKEEKQIKDKNNRSMSGMEQPEENKTTGTICPTCGLPMVSNGSCEGCQQCGHSTGCS